MKIIKTITASFILCYSLAIYSSALAQQGQQPAAHPDVAVAQKARDRASVKDLQSLVEKTRKEAARTKRFDAYARLALFNLWLCEAIESHDDKALFKQVAEDGVAAAEKAVALNPRSSEAHWLLGDLLSQLIPHVYGGGMRYGQRATKALDRAIELDPRNANAYVSRAISYYYTPESFAGSKTKAFDMLQKAVESDPAADTPHIWLALFHLDSGKTDEAVKEIELALKANSDRSFAKFVQTQINEKANKK